MDAKTKEEIELLQELIDSPDTPQDEKELYRDTIKELKAEAEKAEKKPETKKEEPKAKTEKKPATPKPSATKKEAPKKLPVDADKMKAEIKERTGKTEEECEGIIAEYRQLREKSKKIEAKRLGKLDDEGKLIAGTKEKTAAAVIETAAENIKDKLEKQVDKLEKEAEKGDPTPDQIEARINKNLGQLSKEMTKQATGFIKGIQAELGKADKTEAKQFLMNVRAEIDELLSKFAGGGAVGNVDEMSDSEIEKKYDEILSVQILAGDVDEDEVEELSISEKREFLENYKDEYAEGAKINDWKNAKKGDSARVLSENKMGLIIKDYGRKFHLKFVDGSEKTYDASELEFYRFKDEYAGGGWLRDRRQVNQSQDYETRYEKKNNTGRTSYSKKKNSVASIFAGGGEIKYVLFNKDEDEAYESALEYYLNEGHSDLKAERLAISDLKKEFPRLKKELVGNYKISLGTSIASEFEGGGGIDGKVTNWYELNAYEIRHNNEYGDNHRFKTLDEAKEKAKNYIGRESVGRITIESVDSNKEEVLEILEIDNTSPNKSWKKINNLRKFGGGGSVDDLREGSKIGFLRENGRYEWADVLSIEGDNVNLVVRHPKRRQWDNYFTETKERIRRFTNEFSEDWKDGRYVMKIKYDTGGFVQTYNITQGNMSSSSVNPSQFAVGGDIPPFEGERFSQEEFDYRLNLAKSQIISDIMDGTVDPSKVNNFGDLADFVDHNYYGGFIEDDYDHSESFVFEMKVQDALADWIKEGGINKALENPEMFAVGGSVEDQISYADARINNLKELRSVSNEDMRENIDFQIEAIENQKAKLLSGELVPRKKLFGLF